VYQRLRVSDAQTEDKVSVSVMHKIMIAVQQYKSVYIHGICQASLWSAIVGGTKEYMSPTKQPIDGKFLCSLGYFLEY